MTRTEKALAWGGGLIAAILVGLGIYEETKKPAAPPGTQMVPLKQGRRYSVSFSCASSGASPSISALAGVSVVGGSAVPAANGMGGTFQIDFSGTSGSYPVNTSGCSITLQDIGPAGGGVAGVHQGGIGHGNPVPIGGVNHGIPLQSLHVTTNGTYSAQAVKMGKLNVSAPWPIASIDPTPATYGIPAIFGDNANIVLSGNPGKIVIRGLGQGNPSQVPLPATINVA